MLDLQLQALMQQAAEQGAPDFADLPPQECRQFFRNFLAMVDALPPDGVEFRDRSIPGPGGDLPIRVYRPQDAAGPCPILMYFHGGGWVLASTRPVSWSMQQLLGQDRLRRGRRRLPAGGTDR